MILQYLLEFISFVLDLSNKRLCYNKYVCCSFCEVMLNVDFLNLVLEGNQFICWVLIFMNDIEIYYCVFFLIYYVWNRVLVFCEVYELVYLFENGFIFMMVLKWCVLFDYDIRVLQNFV